MGLVLFFGCALVAFGPALALFITFISKRGQLVVLMIGSSVFWLLAILVTSIVWYIILPLRTLYFIIVPLAVILEELMRWCFYKMYTKAESGIRINDAILTIPMELDYFSASIAIGLGFGLTHAVVMYGSVLVWSIGPASLFAPACPQVSIFLLSAIFSFGFIALHVFLTVIAFDAFHDNTWWKIAIILGGHLSISLFTLLNQEGGSCVASISLVYFALAVIGGVATFSAISSTRLLKRAPVTTR